MEILQFITSIYQKGLGCGIFSVEEVIRFCDKVIEEIDNPPIEIIEASLMRNAKTDDIQDKLSEYHMLPYDELGAGIILSVIGHKFSKKEIDIVSAVRYSSGILMHSGLCYEHDYYSLYNIEDMYDLATEQIYGDLFEIEAEFEREINKYAEYYNVFIEYLDKVHNK